MVEEIDGMEHDHNSHDDHEDNSENDNYQLSNNMAQIIFYNEEN